MINIKVNPSCTWGDTAELEKYLSFLSSRQDKYPSSSTQIHLEIAQDVSDHGYSKVESFMDPQRLLVVKDEFNKVRDSGNLQYQDAYTEQCALPLVNLPSVYDVVFDDEVVRLASAYFGCLPTLNNVQVRRSKATHLSEGQLPGNGQTTLFHCDKDSPRFVKFFFYLDDVGTDNGPFTYVHGSHIEKFTNWRSQYRRSESEILSIYGKDRIKTLTGKVGDLILGNTNGFHKGKKVTEGERLLMTAYYSVHPTQWQTTYGGQIKKQDYDNLPASKKPMADYLNKV